MIAKLLYQAFLGFDLTFLKRYEGARYKSRVHLNHSGLSFRLQDTSYLTLKDSNELPPRIIRELQDSTIDAQAYTVNAFTVFLLTTDTCLAVNNADTASYIREDVYLFPEMNNTCLVKAGMYGFYVDNTLLNRQDLKNGRADSRLIYKGSELYSVVLRGPNDTNILHRRC